jgi:ABC-type spermidine/putrescine transport system permease subunit II
MVSYSVKEDQNVIQMNQIFNMQWENSMIKRTKEQRWRDGMDWTIIIVIILIIAAAIIGVLENNGHLNILP